MTLPERLAWAPRVVRRARARDPFVAQARYVVHGARARVETGLAILATVRAHLGSLDKVVRLIKSLGMVNSTPDFGEQPKVINGYSDLMKDVFGDAGVGTRSAVGMAALPAGIAVEIEAIFHVREGG